MASILISLHKRFYESTNVGGNPDVKAILPAMRPEYPHYQCWYGLGSKFNPSRGREDSLASKLCRFRVGSLPLLHSVFPVLCYSSRILKGVVLLFSGIIETKMPPHRSPLWQLAIAHGARCTTTMSEEVTHLAARRKGTEKVKAALEFSDVYIVHIDWLTQSFAQVGPPTCAA